MKLKSPQHEIFYYKYDQSKNNYTTLNNKQVGYNLS